jgi:hypothetical protein
MKSKKINIIIVVTIVIVVIMYVVKMCYDITVLQTRYVDLFVHENDTAGNIDLRVVRQAIEYNFSFDSSPPRTVDDLNFPICIKIVSDKFTNIKYTASDIKKIKNVIIIIITDILSEFTKYHIDLLGAFSIETPIPLAYIYFNDDVKVIYCQSIKNQHNDDIRVLSKHKLKEEIITACKAIQQHCLLNCK